MSLNTLTVEVFRNYSSFNSKNKDERTPYSFTSIVQIETTLSDGDLSRLARRISPQNLSTIAIEQLDFTSDQLETMEDECRENVDKFRRNILIKWRNKSIKHTRQVNDLRVLS